jgi:purine nucleoside permease
MKFPAILLTTALLCSALPLASAQPAPAPSKAPAPIPVKVVIVAMFEPGQDTGDAPGELQYWVERDHLDHIYPLPAAYHAARMNDSGELAIVTGQGTAHASATIMALGLDPRFDLSHAYWIIAGIAGATPERASLGSAVWANWIVDGDLGYEIDARELPPDWSTGFLPLRKKTPYEQPVEPLEGQVFETNHSLTTWAYNLTKAVPLDDSPKLAEIRSHFDGAHANHPPEVLLGDEVSSSTFWHGKLMSQWATQWLSYFTQGQGTYTTTAMEDTGSLLSLHYLALAGRTDPNRILVLRTVSNYDQQPRGLTASESLTAQRISKYAAYLPSLEAAYRVAHTVAAEIETNWPKYQDHIPAAQ